jgi:N-acetylneuraminic acid mutarotase
MPTGRKSLVVGVVNNKIYAIGGWNGYLTAVEEYDPAADQWTTKTPMPVSQIEAAVGVVNNKIYVIGGSISGNYYSTIVSEYDPATNQWTTKASMPTGRHFLAVGVVNNKIYAIGGAGSGDITLATVEEYDPATNTWTNCGGTCASMPTARYVLAVGVVNNKIYAIGGCSNVGCSPSTLSTVEEYDPAANTWTTKTSMLTARQGFAVGVVNNKVYAIGGWSGGYLTTVEEGTFSGSGSFPAWNNPPTANAGADRSATVGVSESFTGSGSDQEGDSLSYAWDFNYQNGEFTIDSTLQNPTYTYTATGTYTVVLRVTDSKGAWNQDSLTVWVGLWATKANMPTARGYLSVGVVNNKVYAIGGHGCLTTVEEYDPSTNTWTTKTSMQTGRGYLAVGVVSNKIYAVGGQCYDGSSTNVLAAVEEYDPTTNQWATKASVPTTRSGLAVGVVNNKIYVIGGWNGGAFATVEEYDPATNTWTNCGGTCASMPTARFNFGVGVVNNKIYAIGGWGSCSSNPCTTVEEYDPSTNTWTTKASMPTGRLTLAVGVVNNKIYAIGGCGDGSCITPLTTAEEYNPTTNTWTTKASIQTSRGGLAVGVVNNKIYAIGGDDTNPGYLATVEEGTVE